MSSYKATKLTDEFGSEHDRTLLTNPCPMLTLLSVQTTPCAPVTAH